MLIGKTWNVTYLSTGSRHSHSHCTRRISMRKKWTETANQRQRVSAWHRLAMTVGLVPAFCTVAAAQIEGIRERGPHKMYGDIRVEAESGKESGKPLSPEVQLFII